MYYAGDQDVRRRHIIRPWHAWRRSYEIVRYRHDNVQFGMRIAHLPDMRDYSHMRSV